MRNLYLTLLSVILLSCPWMEVASVTILFAFVPLLWLQHKNEGKKVMPWVITTFALWNIATTYWVSYSTLFGGISAIVINTALLSLVFWIYNYVWQRAKRALAYTVLVSCWIGFEYFYLNAEISWPWLTLGHAFSGDVKLIQWYEYTGSLGGSLWVWICNLLLFKALERTVANYQKNRRYLQNRPCLRYWIMPLTVLLLPVGISLLIYYTYKETYDPIKVSVIQPNIDPYKEKFEGMSPEQQQRIILDLAAEAPKGVDYFVAPETALDNTFWIEGISHHPGIENIRSFLREEAPQARFIIGLSTREYLGSKQGQRQKPTPTARTNGRLDYYYDLHNSAIQIDTTPLTPLYHKSMLVIGVEKLPYPQYLSFLENFAIDLGGTSGSLATQKERSVFSSADGKRTIGAAICWEAVYGEFFAGFVSKGAQAMFIISNDGWWRNTFGHRLLFSYSRLRAVETRRSIARSANTGTSGFINQRGDVLGTLGWDRRGQLTETIHLNDKITFYVRFGDMTGRLAGYVFVICLLYHVAYRLRKKDHLHKKTK